MRTSPSSVTAEQLIMEAKIERLDSGEGFAGIDAVLSGTSEQLRQIIEMVLREFDFDADPDCSIREGCLLLAEIADYFEQYRDFPEPIILKMGYESQSNSIDPPSKAAGDPAASSCADTGGQESNPMPANSATGLADFEVVGLWQDGLIIRMPGKDAPVSFRYVTTNAPRVFDEVPVEGLGELLAMVQGPIGPKAQDLICYVMEQSRAG